MNHPLRWLSLVALREGQLPAFETLAASLGGMFPSADEPLLAAATENLLTLTFGELTAAVTLVDREIPATQLEGPLATAWYWQQAAGAFAQHTSHMLITLVDDGGKPLEKSTRLTQLTAALATEENAVGIFWGPGRLVHEPAAFVDQARQMADDNFPLYLWVDFRVERLGENEFRLFTTGLEALGKTELEVTLYQGDPQQLLSFCYNIAHYVLEQNKTLNEGDTIGLTDQVQVTARVGPSMFDEQLEVVQLEFATN